MNHDLLRRLHGEIRQRKFATIDIEAVDWVNPYAVGFFDGKSYFEFADKTPQPDHACVRAALEHVLQPAYCGYWIYAHNGGNYDFLFFLRHLITQKMTRKFRVEITPIQSCVFRLDVYERDKDGDDKKTKDGWRKWTFIDSARLFPIKLDDLGETFNLGRKVKLEMSYNELAKPENREKMSLYLKNDCILLHKGLTKFQDIINDLGGEIQPTLPATALDLFRRKYLKDDIHVNRHFSDCPDFGNKPAESKCRGCAHDLIREGYYGGRSEIFRMKFEPHPGHEKAHLFDINSHYPHCMLSAMPIGPAIRVPGGEMTETSVYNNAKRLTGIVKCDVEIPTDCYLPPLPVRHRGKLVFPVGKFTGTWDTAELCLLRHVGGRITKVHDSVWFENAPVFVRYINRLYEFRDKSKATWNKGMDWIAKLLGNSSYGKFAMREERSRFLLHPESPVGFKCVDLASDIWLEDVRVTPNYIVPQLSVHITALARARLWEYLMKVIAAGGKIYYCDTDSVVCSGYQFETGGKLGDMKLESIIKRAEFVLPKLYLIETDEPQKGKTAEEHTKVKAKGMGPGIRLTQEQRDQVEAEMRKIGTWREKTMTMKTVAVTEGGDDPLCGQLSEEEFVALIKKGVPIQRHRLMKFREGLAAYARTATTFPRVVASPKQIQSEYDKRTILDDFNTVPLVLGNN